MSLSDSVARKLGFAIAVLPVQFREIPVQHGDYTLVLAVAGAATGLWAEQAVGEVLPAGHRESVHNAEVVAAGTRAAVVGSELMLVVIVEVEVYASGLGTEYLHGAHSDGIVAVGFAGLVVSAGQCVAEEVVAVLFDT